MILLIAFTKNNKLLQIKRTMANVKLIPFAKLTFLPEVVINLV